MADEIIKELWQVKDGIANEYNYEAKTFVAHLRAIKNKGDRAVADLRSTKKAPPFDPNIWPSPLK
jgi:hypothetical protein